MFSLFSIPGLIALLLVLLGGLLLLLGRRQRQSSGLPAGTVLYQDTEEMEAPERPLRSRRYGLLGGPTIWCGRARGAGATSCLWR